MRKLLTTLLALSLLSAPSATARLIATTQNAPAAAAQSSSAAVERGVEEMLARMTLEEKIDLLGGVDDFFVRGVERVGLPRLKMADGPNGVRNFGPATTMPGALAMAATWDTSLIERVGTEIGRDARAKGVPFLLGPGVNIYRAPMNGRDFEYLGEDPFLASRAAVAYIRGVQSQGVAATVKHLAANNSEFDRHNTDSVVDERTLRELYLPAFEAAVKEARVGAIMTSYNLVNGEHASQSGHLMTDVAKREWGFDGVMMSDWGGTYDGVAAANAGQDLEMPGPAHMNRRNLLPAIEQGKISVATIDDKVRRILRTAARFGWLDRDQTDLSIPRFNQQGRRVALDAARAGVVLLKNEGGLLPLDRRKVKSIAVVGPVAYPAVPMGGGSGRVEPFAAVSILEGLSDHRAGPVSGAGRARNGAREFRPMTNEEVVRAVTSREGNRLVTKTLAGLLAVAILFAPAAPRAAAQGGQPPAQKLSRELSDKLPDDLRGAAREHVRLTEADQKRWLAFAPQQLRAETLTALARVPSAVGFVLRQLPREPAALNRVNLMRAMLWFPHWRTEQQRARPALTEVVLKDPDPGVVAQALDTLRGLEMQALRGLLERRLRAAREGGDAELPRALAQEHERWIMIERGAALPSFLRAAPPVFTLKPAAQPVRLVVFGDFGQGTEAQRRVAAAMLREHRSRAFDFGITVGDNFYPRGMDSPSDPRWQTQWEDLYTPLGIEFYPSLGNHDWVNPDSVAAELLYAGRSRSWRMPAPYYTFTAGPVQFFAVDTDEISEAQAAWLREGLEKSKATWKVVYGHHPVFVSHVWGPTYTEEMRRVLWPLIQGRVDLYLSGHHHSLQHLRSPEDGAHFVTSGGGGAGPYPVDEKNPLALFARQINGFTTVEATERELTFKHFGDDGGALYTYTLRK